MAARRRRAPVAGEAGAAPVAEAAAASASSAAPEPAAGIMASGGLQPVVAVDNLAKFIEETRANDDSIEWEKTVHQLQIAGVTVTVTGSLYAILAYVNTYITTANITALISALASAFGTYASVISTWLTANPHVIILLLLASVLGATIEPITIAIAARSTRDPAIRAIRVKAVKKATEWMRKPGSKAYNAVGTLLKNVGANAAASAAASAAGSAANEIATHVRTAASSAVTAMSSSVAAGAAAAASAARAAATRAKEFLVGPPDLVKRRGDILTLRRAIYIYTEAKPAAEGGSTEDHLDLRDKAHHLLGQIVTALGKLNAAGITDEEIESYIGKRLPGLTGMAVEVGTSVAGLAAAAKSGGSSVIDAIRNIFDGTMRYVLHGDLAGKVATKKQKPLTEPALEVDSMIQTFKGLGVNPPGAKPFEDIRPGEVLFTVKPPSTSNRAAKRGRRYEGDEGDEGGEDPSGDASSSAAAAAPAAPASQRPARADVDANAPNPPGSATPAEGRHTKRKHKKRHSKKSVRRHRRKTVSHRRGKRTHNRRRTNRRATKRSKK